jgi:hypothetical protein
MRVDRRSAPQTGVGRGARLAAKVVWGRRTDAVLTGLGWRVRQFWARGPDVVVESIGRELIRQEERRPVPAATQPAPTVLSGGGSLGRRIGASEGS